MLDLNKNRTNRTSQYDANSIIIIVAISSKNLEINPHKIICMDGQYIKSRTLGKDPLIK
jgi:hypothetical protein